MDNKVKVLSNFLWRFAERCGAQMVQFLVSLVLARLLARDVYGVISLVLVFTTILNVFVDSGMANALIQKKNADDLDFSTVFYFNIIVCTLLYVIMFFCAPMIARFYRLPEITPVIRVLSLTLILSGLKNVQQAFVSRTLQFKRFFFATLLGTILAAVVGVLMALNGFGVWALVAQQLTNLTVDTTILWITVRWRPRKMFSFERLKSLFSYGWKLLVSALLDTGYNNLRMLLIGKLYTSDDLALYNRGRQFPYLIVSNVNSSIDSVLLPVLSREQDEVSRVKAITRRAIQTSTYIMAPLMIGLIVCATPLVQILLTEKWIDSVPYMRIFCVCFLMYPIHTANLNAMKSLGRSDLFLRLEIVKKVIGITILLSTVWISPMVMAYSMLVESVMGMIVNTWPNRKLLKYGFFEQMVDILPGVLMAVVMGVVIYPIMFFGLGDIATLCLMVPAGMAVYLTGSLLIKPEPFIFLLNFLNPSLKKKISGKSFR